MTTSKRVLLAALVAGIAGLGSMSANAFWGWGPFGVFPGGWGGPGWGSPWGWGGAPWYGGYPYHGGWGAPYGYGHPYGWGVPAYGYPAVVAPSASQANASTGGQ
jgi:hypothetical protein